MPPTRPARAPSDARAAQGQGRPVRQLPRLRSVALLSGLLADFGRRARQYSRWYSRISAGASPPRARVLLAGMRAKVRPHVIRVCSACAATHARCRQRVEQYLGNRFPASAAGSCAYNLALRRATAATRTLTALLRAPLDTPAAFVAEGLNGRRELRFDEATRRARHRCAPRAWRPDAAAPQR